MSSFNKPVLPKDTSISKYFLYKGKIFENMQLPDGRVLVQIVHTWGDGEKMKYGFQYKDGISRTGINPLHIVYIYGKQVHPIDQRLINDGIDLFLINYSRGQDECASG